MSRVVSSMILLLAVCLPQTTSAEFVAPTCESLDEWTRNVPTHRGASREEGQAALREMQDATFSAAIFGEPYDELTAEELFVIRNKIVECADSIDPGVNPQLHSRLRQTVRFVSRSATYRSQQGPPRTQ